MPLVDPLLSALTLIDHESIYYQVPTSLQLLLPVGTDSRTLYIHTSTTDLCTYYSCADYVNLVYCIYLNLKVCGVII